MIICPFCKHENLDGMMFCEDCGNQIAGPKLNTDAIRPDQIKSRLDAASEVPHKPGHLETWASLHLIESGLILPLGDRSEFTLGRVSESQPIMPDIDLTPYQAYTNGVSRIHAVIKRIDKRVSVMDLGSSNGTYLNNDRLIPNAETPIGNNDMLSLGKLKIQIVLNF